MFFMGPAVIGQIMNRNKGDPVLLRHFPQLRRAHHGAVFVHDFTADAALLHARKAKEVHRRLRVAAPHKHAAVPCDQREYMTRPSEVSRDGGRVRQFSHRKAAFFCGNPRGRILMIHGYRKGRLMIIRVLGNHRGQSQSVCDLCAHRRADQPSGMLRHEVDVFLCGELPGTDQVPFIFTFRIICTENQFPCFQILQRLFNRCILIFFIFSHFLSSPFLRTPAFRDPRS